jgi:Na+/H+-dicarboxylate symporter
LTGGGFVALAATIPAIGILPVGGLALLIGVDRFMAEIRAATNLSSNIIATLVVAPGPTPRIMPGRCVCSTAVPTIKPMLWPNPL